MERRTGVGDLTAEHPVQQHELPRQWKLPVATFWVAVIALIGVLVIFYPSAAAWFSQYQQSQLLVGVEETVVQAAPGELGEELLRAREYNAALSGGALIASGANVPTAVGGAADGFDYSSMLRATEDGVMGRLRMGAIALDLPIYHGTSDETLEKGVGHLEGTALPVGEVSLHSVLTAHRGLPSAELFTRLDEVEVDDRFTIEVFGEVLVYRVIETRVVEPDETQALEPRYGRDLVTLVTCTPLGINSHRILVTGERVTPTPIEDLEHAGSAPDIPGFPWWAVGLASIVLILGVGVWRAGAAPPPGQ